MTVEIAGSARSTSRRLVPGWLRRLGCAVGQVRSRESARLAVDGLHESCAALAPGSVHAVYATPRTPACEALLWETAHRAAMRNVTVVLACPAAAATARLAELGFAGGVPARGWPKHLNVLALEPAGSVVLPAADGTCQATAAVAGAATAGSAAANAAAAGSAAARTTAAPRATSALPGLKLALRRNSLCLVECAERWFNWPDARVLAREARLITRWCARRRITLVLIFSSSAGDEARARDGARPSGSSAHAGRLAFHGRLRGIARLDERHGDMEWHTDFWRAGSALVVSETYPLRFDGAGHLSVAQPLPELPGSAGAWLALDEQRVVVSAPVVNREAWVPHEWEVRDDNAAVLAACAEARAATVVFSFTNPADIDSLCAAVHALRRRSGRALKIVVVERGASLRLPFELAVLTLGADLVIGRDVPFSRMLAPLRSLQGQLHTRRVLADYRASLAACVIDSVVGYLPLHDFCRRVSDACARSAPLDLPHILVKLTLRPDVAHLDALRACAPRRRGDIVTADAAHVFVFLCACRPPEANTVLQRILKIPMAQLFDAAAVLTDHLIGQEIDSLALTGQRARPPDYSDPDRFVDGAREPAPALSSERGDATQRRPALALPTSALAPPTSALAPPTAALAPPTPAPPARTPAKAAATPLQRAVPPPPRGAQRCAMPLHRQESA